MMKALEFLPINCEIFSILEYFPIFKYNYVLSYLYPEVKRVGLFRFT